MSPHKALRHALADFSTGPWVVLSSSEGVVRRQMALETIHPRDVDRRQIQEIVKCEGLAVAAPADLRKVSTPWRASSACDTSSGQSLPPPAAVTLDDRAPSRIT